MISQSELAAGREKWSALYALVAGSLMVNVDSTIVNVALPAIRLDLGFSEESLIWVVNAYLVAFGGFSSQRPIERPLGIARFSQ